MKIVEKVYECEYCGRLLRTKTGAYTHERHCRKNERNARACYTCKHYEAVRNMPYYEDNPKEITIDAYFDGPYGEMPDKKTLQKNVCKADNKFLFNSRRMNESWVEWLENSDEWKVMPTAFNGCENYEPRDYYKRPNYPLSHKIQE